MKKILPLAIALATVAAVISCDKEPSDTLYINEFYLDTYEGGAAVEVSADSREGRVVVMMNLEYGAAYPFPPAGRYPCFDMAMWPDETAPKPYAVVRHFYILEDNDPNDSDVYFVASPGDVTVTIGNASPGFINFTLEGVVTDAEDAARSIGRPDTRRVRLTYSGRYKSQMN